MKKLILVLASCLALTSLVGCKGNANLYNPSASQVDPVGSQDGKDKKECPTGECKKGCMLPIVKDHILEEIVGAGHKPGACNVCIDTLDWNMLSEDQREEVQGYRDSHGGELIIADGAKIENGACVVPEPAEDVVCKYPDADNYNTPISESKNCCVFKICGDENYEEYVDQNQLLADYDAFYESLIPAEETQGIIVTYDNSLCVTEKTDPVPPEVCAVSDTVCLPYSNDNSAASCDPSKAGFYRFPEMRLLNNDKDSDDRPFSFEEIYIIDENGDKVVLTSSTYVQIDANNQIKISECVPYKKLNYRICVDTPSTPGINCDTAEIEIDRTEDCKCTVCE